MKKYIITLTIVIAGLFIAGCVVDHVFYCPYCGSAGLTEEPAGVYKCNNSSCGKTFGAKEL
ncbi:MAG: hypothetical protein LBI28_08700 [Treponema sp.]|jgi:DNA-directed RNA polymerase subunit RPC12/RpoP|nr:hypothetical protein [Treponema sp.]